ncbi:calbindin-32-like isoform X2 [Paramacrobiotus metropolitanus]|uniref:calbindin-32-like isoform X2 n=1 Tax=Paramacrobiotus metropolitanus TaxID=2943436 RepID=UPI00244626DC|nr:calbindin-32-like isoform X2 [Paramacrobiotus metropolitanus]
MSIADLDFMNITQRRNYIDEKLREKGLEKVPLSADRFLEIWSHYDKDGNLTIEEQELDSFLDEYLTSAYAKYVEVMKDNEIKGIKKVYMQGLNAEEGGRISLGYMAKLLPVELGIFVLFRSESRTKTAVEFMEIWKKYDKDLSGYIDANEFTLLLAEMLRNNASPSEKIDCSKAREYAEAFLPFFDVNGDGNLGLNELARLLPSRENFVQAAVDKAFSLEGLKPKDIQSLLEKYDKDVNGSLEGNELSAFVRDILAASNSDYTAQDVKDFEKVIMKVCDTDANGSIDAKELNLIITSIAQAKRKGGDGIKNFYAATCSKK